MKGRKTVQLPGSGVRRTGPAAGEIDWVGVAGRRQPRLIKVGSHA